MLQSRKGESAVRCHVASRKGDVADRRRRKPKSSRRRGRRDLGIPCSFSSALLHAPGGTTPCPPCYQQPDDMDSEYTQSIASLANQEIKQGEYQPADDEPANGKKRKADDGQPQQRSKRNRYISIACNEVSWIGSWSARRRSMLTRL